MVFYPEFGGLVFYRKCENYLVEKLPTTTAQKSLYDVGVTDYLVVPPPTSFFLAKFALVFLFLLQAGLRVAWRVLFLLLLIL